MSSGRGARWWRVAGPKSAEGDLWIPHPHQDAVDELVDGGGTNKKVHRTRHEWSFARLPPRFCEGLCGPDLGF